MPRRAAHKTAHNPCPNGVFNWADCDAILDHQWGRCKAVTGDREPKPCSRWAVGDEGYCGQHYIAESERVKREERIAIARDRLDVRISAFLAWTAKHPSLYDSPTAPKLGIYTEIPEADVDVLPAPSQVKLIAIRVGKKPHRLTELA